MTEQEKFYEEWFYVIDSLKFALRLKKSVIGNDVEDIEISSEDIKQALANKFVWLEMVKQIDGYKKYKAGKDAL